MTEQILSAGVYAYENDQSFFSQGTQQTGLAVVGPTEKGPAFVPTDVTSYSQFTALFGADSSNSYVPQTVYSYLQSGNTVKVARVLGNGGYVYTVTRPLAAITSGSSILAVLYPSKNDTATVAINTGSAVGGTYGAFNGNFFAYTQSGFFSSSFSASLNPASPIYLSKVLGTDENYQTGSVFPYLLFSNFITGSGVGNDNYTGSIASLSFTATNCSFTSSNPGGYDHAATPWVLSDSGVQLFKFHHRSDGLKTNKDIKVCIDNISQGATPADYSTFDVLVRQWNDTDRVPSILEQFIGVSLDPDASNYIVKSIGDKYSEYNTILTKVVNYGDFDSRSSFVRIEAAEGVSAKATHPQLFPKGHEALYETIAGFTGKFLPAAVIVQSTASLAAFSGFDFTNSDNWNYLNPVPLGASVGLNTAFTMGVNDNKFVLPFQGGTDGMNITTIKKKGAGITSSNLFGFNLATSAAAGAGSYAKAINILSNVEEYNFDLLAMPGVIEEYHSAVTLVAENMCEGRTDAVYLRDIAGLNSTVVTAVSTAAGLDSSYSAAYYPWVKVKDLNSTKDIFVPATAIVPQAYAYNDRVAAEWFAPAGLNRGGLGGAIDTRVRLTKADRDALYAGRVNPIAKFQTSGVVIWGQKTLQIRDTALNRINVRRLLINLREYISGVALNFVFENNTIATRNSLIASITPYMENVQTRQGLYAFRVQIDDTLNTNDVIDRNQLVGKIYVSPVKSIEFILLEFNITATGVDFG